MSSRSPQSRRTYAGSRSWSLDHHQRPMHVLRSRCHGSVPFDPASPLGKERMVRAVPRDRAGSLAAKTADFCKKICQKPTYAVQQIWSLLDHLVGAALASCTKGCFPCHAARSKYGSHASTETFSIRSASAPHSSRASKTTV